VVRRTERYWYFSMGVFRELRIARASKRCISFEFRGRSSVHKKLIPPRSFCVLKVSTPGGVRPYVLRYLRVSMLWVVS
jgi:hypothetical protein